MTKTKKSIKIYRNIYIKKTLIKMTRTQLLKQTNKK